MSSKQKYYVVWQGKEPGIYTSWEACKAQVIGVEGATYKSFATEAEALTAFQRPASDYVVRGAHRKAETGADAATQPTSAPAQVAPAAQPAGCAQALAVDAACSGNPGPMEYRGVHLPSGQQVFHYGPVHGTNNIGEFLAIVHGLALLKQRGVVMPIYSDSRNALSWVKQRRCRTKLARTPKTEGLFQLIARAEQWLRTHDYADIPLLKWETSEWGEVPADFGRK